MTTIQRTTTLDGPVQRRRFPLRRVRVPERRELLPVRKRKVERQERPERPVLLQPALLGRADLDEVRDRSAESGKDLVGGVVDEPRTVRLEMGEEESGCGKKYNQRNREKEDEDRNAPTVSVSVVPLMFALAARDSRARIGSCASKKASTEPEEGVSFDERGSNENTHRCGGKATFRK